MKPTFPRCHRVLTWLTPPPQGRIITSHDSANTIVKRGLVPYNADTSFFAINGLAQNPRTQIYDELVRLYPRCQWDPYFSPATDAALPPCAAAKQAWSDTRDNRRVLRHLHGLDELAPVVWKLAIGLPTEAAAVDPNGGGRFWSWNFGWHAMGWGGFMDTAVLMMRRWRGIEVFGVFETHGDEACLAQHVPSLELELGVGEYSTGKLWDVLFEWHQMSARNGDNPLSEDKVRGIVLEEVIEEDATEEMDVSAGDATAMDEDGTECTF